MPGEPESIPSHVCPGCSTTNVTSARACVQCGRVLPLPAGMLVASRYQVIEALGSGGMGTVYRAHDLALEEIVALKVLRADLAQIDELARRFRSEIKLARRVGHRNVCRVFEYGEAGPIRYISMELVDGVNLRHLITHAGGLPISEAFDIVVQAVSGLEAIHELGVVHRDLKSANIMRDKRGVVKLMDFGIAKEHGLKSTDATATGVIIGTPEYMSPEQATGQKVDVRSDLYSMGVVIYEVFTGAVPFKGDTPLATILKHLQEAPSLEVTTGLSPVLKPILKRCLAKNAGNRYASATQLRKDLERARGDAVGGMPTDRRLAAEGIELVPGDEEATHVTSRPMVPAPTVKPSIPTELGPRPRSRRAVWVAGLVVVVGALAAIGVMLTRRPSAPVAPAEPSPVLIVEEPVQPTPAPSVATAAPTETVPTTRPPAVPPVRTPGRDESATLVAQLSAVDRMARVDVERAYADLLGVAATAADDRRVQERLGTLRQRLVTQYVARGNEALGQAASGKSSSSYERAADYFDKALELDPANGEAQSGRAVAARGPAKPTVPADHVAFVQSDTRFTASPLAGAPAGMGQLPPGMVVKPAQPPTPQARIVIEIDPPQLRPGDKYVARYYVFNQSQSPLSMTGASVRNSTGSDTTTGGSVALASKLAPPGTRTLLLETRDAWRQDPSASWSTTLTLMLEDGSVYSGTLHTQR